MGSMSTGILLALALVPLTVLAESVSSDPSDPFSLLLGFGPLGLMVLGFITGWIVPGSTHKKAEAEVARLQRLFDDQVFPMAQTYASTMATATQVMHDVTDELRRGHAEGR